MGIKLIPAIPNPVKNLVTAKMVKVFEKALANPKTVVITYEIISPLFLPNLRTKK